MNTNKIKVNKEITYDELSELLQQYLDAGDVLSAVEYCNELIRVNNPYGYLFQGFIYEEGSGEIVSDLEKALWCYEQAQRCGIEVEKDIVLLKKKMMREDS